MYVSKPFKFLEALPFEEYYFKLSELIVYMMI